MNGCRDSTTHIRRRALVLLSGVLVLTTGPSADATTVRQFDLEEMVETARQIFLGTCLSARCEASDDEGICTRTRFKVEERIKGTFDADTLQLRLPVGTVDGIRCTIPGMPSFAPGEEVVLFLTEEGADGYPWVVGLSQGKFSVASDPVSRRKVVVNAASEETVHGKHIDPIRSIAIAGPTASGVAGIAGVGLDAFLTRIRSILAEQKETIPADSNLSIRTFRHSNIRTSEDLK